MKPGLPLPSPLRLLPALLVLAMGSACRVSDTSTPEVVSDTEVAHVLGERVTPFSPPTPVPGVPLNTLWRFRVHFVDANDQVLATRDVSVLNVLGEWQSELAPMTLTRGWEAFRSPGLFASGEQSLAAALRAAPAALALDVIDGVTGIDQTEWSRPPAGAARQLATLLETCPVELRSMRQYHWRPRGLSVVDIGSVKEEMRWREYRVNGPCRRYP